VSLVARPARNHPQQVGSRGANPDVDDRATTGEDFARFAARFGGFTVDAAAAAHNAKCERYWDEAANGLEQSWAGERVWCNPPYSNIRPWIERAWAESRAALVVMLLPANRTEQGWWQDLVEPFRDRPGSPLTVEFLPGRMRFINRGKTSVGANERPPFGCCLLVWRRLAPEPTPTLLDGLTDA
jgi:phage N-6-adenine-methyltransferase